MLKLLPIPHVLQMNEIFPTSRTTDYSGMRLLTGGPDVRDSQARSNDIGKVFALRATFIMAILDLASKLTTVYTTAFSGSP